MTMSVLSERENPPLSSLNGDWGEARGVGAVSLLSSSELWTLIHQFVFTMHSSIHSNTKEASVFLMNRLPRCFKQSNSLRTEIKTSIIEKMKNREKQKALNKLEEDRKTYWIVNRSQRDSVKTGLKEFRGGICWCWGGSTRCCNWDVDQRSRFLRFLDWDFPMFGRSAWDWAGKEEVVICWQRRCSWEWLRSWRQWRLVFSAENDSTCEPSAANGSSWSTNPSRAFEEKNERSVYRI